MKIVSHLPSKTLNNEFFEHEFFEKVGWKADDIYHKTGIRQRHIAAEDEFALDLAEKACLKLFDKYGIDKNIIDYVIYCTQTPDTIVPANSGMLQSRLGLKEEIGVIDYMQACTGYLYGLSIAKGLLLSRQATNLLMVVADVVTKNNDPDDPVAGTLFSDGATVTLLTRKDAENIGEFVFGTEGRNDIMGVKDFGMIRESESLNPRFYMKGPEIFDFILKVVPPMIRKLLAKSGVNAEDIDHFVFHQANGYILEKLREKMEIPPEKFHVHLADVGNTIASSIPIALEHLYDNEIIKPDHNIILAGFGSGLSWAATTVNLKTSSFSKDEDEDEQESESLTELEELNDEQIDDLFKEELAKLEDISE